MTEIRILQYPDPLLKRKGVTVTDFGPAFQIIIDNMFETHYAQENCAALAATQLDIPQAPRVTVIDFSPEKNQPLCLVNPIITSKEDTQLMEEACMSVGEGGIVSAKIERARKITVTAKDRHGKEIEIKAEDFLAQCIQHEMDHLDGVLFIDYLSALKRKRIEKQLAKHARWQKENADSE